MLTRAGMIASELDEPTIRTDRAWRLAVFEADWGRDTDWWVELDGRRLARLTGGRFVDMFWWGYRIDVTGFDDEARRLIEDRALWLYCKLTFRSVPFGVVVADAFCGGRGPENGYVTMRGLYIPLDGPTWWERLVVWHRRRRRAG
jgi:hypothetical protein